MESPVPAKEERVRASYTGEPYMSCRGAGSSKLHKLLIEAATGDGRAYAEVLDRSGERLVRLCRKMLRNYPHLRRWEQTDDIFQSAVLRLYQSLHQVRPTTERAFFGLACLQIRRTLIDLARHHFGPQGGGARHQSDVIEPASQAGEPENLEAWARFHEIIDSLPDSEREVFSLIWYGGLTQADAATLLGVSDRTVLRRMQSARVLIHRAMQGEHPSGDESQ